MGQSITGSTYVVRGAEIIKVECCFARVERRVTSKKLEKMSKLRRGNIDVSSEGLRHQRFIPSQGLCTTLFPNLIELNYSAPKFEMLAVLSVCDQFHVSVN